MDCDQVFMILTRGPFPTGEPWDELVETHLESCTDCWRLAEALRPALEVFQEAVPPSEGRDLPGYWGDARPATAMVAQLTHGVSRTAVVTSMQQRACLPYTTSLGQSLASPLSTNVFRVTAFAATMTLAALALASLLNQ